MSRPAARPRTCGAEERRMVDAPVLFPLAGRKVFVAGHRGMVGGALLRRLERTGATVLTATRQELDLRQQDATQAWLAAHRPDAVFVAAATVGGILANDTRPAEFLYDNMKIAALKLCEAYRRQWGCDFISAQPTNLYGPGDTYDAAASHVIPALLLKMHRAKAARAPEVEIWGTGAPRREFLHVDDLADALVFLMERYSGEGHVNVGWGSDISIAELARLVADTVGYRGAFRYATDKPDGMPRKLLDVRKLTALGWRPRIALGEGLADAYRWFLANAAAAV